MTKFRKAGTRSALRRFKEPITSINSTNGICYYHAAKAGAILNGTRRARQIGVEIRSTRKTGPREIRRLGVGGTNRGGRTKPRPPAARWVGDSDRFRRAVVDERGHHR